METINNWIERRQAQGHDVAIVILDRTVGEGVLTTVDPKVVAAVQHADGASLIKVKEIFG